MGAKLVLGCGYLGRRVAEAWKSRGDRVHALTRSTERAREFDAAGFNPLVADLTRESFESPAVEAVLFAVSWDRRSGASPRDTYVGGLERTIEALTRAPSLPKVFVFISTTGVYGDGGGEEIDESTACRPTRESGVAYVEAEKRLAASPLADRSVVLRLAGIYGPNRIPLLGELQRGETLAVREEASLNLIHVEDAVTTILACEERAPRPSLYCVADGHPVQRGEWYRAVAEAFGLPEPRFGTLVSDGRRGGDKRIRAEKLRREINPAFQYPNYREGLAAEAARVRE